MIISNENDNFEFNNTVVLQPTRVFEKLKYLIDLFFFNSFELITLSGNITHSVSYLLIQLVTIEDFVTPKRPSTSIVYKRKFDIFDSNKLKEDLHMVLISLKCLTCFTKLLAK